MMGREKTRYLWGLVLLTFGIGILSLAGLITIVHSERSVPSSIVDDVSQLWENELKVGEYVTIVDDKTGEVIEKMSRTVYEGDSLITENNKEYKITSVSGNRAEAQLIGEAEGVVWKPEWDEEIAAVEAANEIPVQSSDKAQIGMYFTHSDESYIPTDGSESIPGKGGIMKVGTALADALKKNGVSVALDKTPHEPHDSSAYNRSRRTAAQLLKKQPVALIDVHRDGVPDPDFYKDNIEGKDITKVRLVVGRQNPHMATNLEFAKKVKAYIDKEKPGLIKGIFLAKGNYNQDIGPRAMLIEVGTHTNSRFFAENGAQLFAEALPKVLNLKTAGQGGGGATVNPAGESPEESKSAWTSLAWILGIVLVGAAVFLFISTGSIKGMKSKIGEISKTEFANYLGDAKAADKENELNKKAKNKEK